MNYKELQEIGLQEKEARVYLAALELGKGTVQHIAKKAEVKRPTTYVIMEELMNRGLASSFYEGKKQYFVAEDPERLVEMLRKEKEEVEKRETQLNAILPQLHSINNRQTDKPVVKYYEGKEGILTMLEGYAKKSYGQKAHLAYSKDITDNVFNTKEMESLHNLRVQNKIQTTSIYTYLKGDLPSTDDSKKIKVSGNDFPLSCDVAVYEDKMRIASLKGRLIGVIIEDKEIAKTFQTIFKLAEIGAKSLNAKEVK